MSFQQRLMSKVQQTDTCWLWTAAQSTNGYGLMDDAGGSTRRAHRLVYELFVGPIGPGLELDHLCRNRLCVNPAHLEPVTHAENMRRAAPCRTVKTHCPSGHAYDGDNLVLLKQHGRQERVCRTCKRETLRRWRARVKNG